MKHLTTHEPIEKSNLSHRAYHLADGLLVGGIPGSIVTAMSGILSGEPMVAFAGGVGFCVIAAAGDITTSWTEGAIDGNSAPSAEDIALKNMGLLQG